MSAKKLNLQEPNAVIPLLYPDHKTPVTRRDFLAQGLIGMSGYVLAPSILSMLSSKAFALDCNAAAGPSGAKKAPAFLAFDLVGGANIAGSNVMVGKQGGQEDFLSSYTTLGLPADMARNVNRDFGLVFHNDSAILRGMQSVITSADVRAKIEGAVFCVASSDDTANNPFNPTYWINGAGAKGELVSILGSRAGDSGGNSRAPAKSINPAARPVRIATPQDALSLVRLGKLAELLSPNKAQKVLKAVESMSAAQLARFSSKDVPDQIKELVQCGYIKSTDMITKFTPASLDATQDPLVTQVFPTLTNAEDQRVATMSKLLLDGYAGAATVEMGGFDYHNGSRATGEARDFQAGRLIGAAIQLAALKQQDLVVYVYSDGSVTSSGALDNSTAGRGKGVWTADSGQRGASFMLMYRAAGKPKLRDSQRRQIGSFKDSGAVDNAATKVSANVETLAKAVVANYLAIQGREGELAKVVGDDPFSTELAQYLIFDKQS